MTDINCDMGEAYGLYKMGDDAALMPLITQANVACGFHGSDFNHMRETVRLAKANDVKVGAHPSLPDLQGFGRREMKMGREELANCIIYQVGALSGFLTAEGMELAFIKPHGALYGMASRDEAVAHAVCDAADVFQVPISGMINCMHETVYGTRGHRLIAEYYADLDYGDNGFVIITREHHAVDPDEAAARCVRAVTEGITTAQSGKEVPVRADSICVHSDTPNAVAVAQAVKNAVAAL